MSSGRRLGLRSIPGTWVPRVRSMSTSVIAVTPSTTTTEAKSRRTRYLASIRYKPIPAALLFLFYLPSVTQTLEFQGRHEVLELEIERLALGLVDCTQRLVQQLVRRVVLEIGAVEAAGRRVPGVVERRHVGVGAPVEPNEEYVERADADDLAHELRKLDEARGGADAVRTFRPTGAVEKRFGLRLVEADQDLRLVLVGPGRRRLH